MAHVAREGTAAPVAPVSNLACAASAAERKRMHG